MNYVFVCFVVIWTFALHLLNTSPEIVCLSDLMGFKMSCDWLQLHSHVILLAYDTAAYLRVKRISAVFTHQYPQCYLQLDLHENITLFLKLQLKQIVYIVQSHVI